MPFISEALFPDFGGGKGKVLALSRWPSPDVHRRSGGRGDQPGGGARERDPLGALGNECSRGGENQLWSRSAPTRQTAALVARHASVIERMARIDAIESAERAPRGSAQIVAGGVTFALPLAGIIDFDAEEARLKKEIARVEGEIGRIDKKLANESFVARAPEEVVEAEREKRALYATDGERLAAALKRVKEAA